MFIFFLLFGVLEIKELFCIPVTNLSTSSLHFAATADIYKLITKQ